MGRRRQHGLHPCQAGGDPELSPLQLYADEAQYWVWSRHLDFGYFTKPPLIAWLIWATTLANNAEPFVRLSSPLLHGAAGLFLFCAARRLYDARVGLASLLLYALMPAVQLGAFVMSTDTPLVACLAGALWAYAAMQSGLETNTRTPRWRAALGLGIALGLAFLAKYAALYAVIGIAAHLSLSPAARKAWTWPAILAAVGAFALLAGPTWSGTRSTASPRSATCSRKPPGARARAVSARRCGSWPASSACSGRSRSRC